MRRHEMRLATVRVCCSVLPSFIDETVLTFLGWNETPATFYCIIFFFVGSFKAEKITARYSK
jgi:hypothetical protein